MCPLTHLNLTSEQQHVSSLERGLHLLSTPPQYQQPPPGPTSFSCKLPLPWQLPERGHYLGDIGDRLWKAGALPSALHQRTSGFLSERCACLLPMHAVNPPLWMVGQREIISFRLPVIIHARQTPSAHCSALVVGLLPSLHSPPVVTKPTAADTSRSTAAASSRNFHIHIVPLKLTYRGQVTLTDHFTYGCCLAHATGVSCFAHCNVQMEKSHRCRHLIGDTK